ncbi:MAG: DUF5518 domain-containing protein [Euryarchaeota archaeon]
MIKWKDVIICSILAILLNIILYGGFLLATLYAGYRVGGEYSTGAIHGALVAVISMIVTMIVNIFYFNQNQLLEGLIGGAPEILAFLLLVFIIFAAILGSIGGTIGAYIKKRTY